VSRLESLLPHWQHISIFVHSDSAQVVNIGLLDNGEWAYRVSSSRSVCSLTRKWTIGSAMTRPATRRTHVERKIFMKLTDKTSIKLGGRSGVILTHGSFTASARQTPAAPADCMDLSAENDINSRGYNKVA